VRFDKRTTAVVSASRALWSQAALSNLLPANYFARVSESSNAFCLTSGAIRDWAGCHLVSPLSQRGRGPPSGIPFLISIPAVESPLRRSRPRTIQPWPRAAAPNRRRAESYRSQGQCRTNSGS